MSARLDVDDLTLAIGGVTALDGVSLVVERHELVAVVGPTGSGKTALLDCVNGLRRPEAGTVRVDGRRLPSRVRAAVRAGIARTFREPRLAGDLDVIENLLVGRDRLMSSGVWTTMLWRGRARGEELDHRTACEEIVDFLDLAAFRHSIVAELEPATQRLVALGRALAARPRVLLLDEPGAGLDANELGEMARVLAAIRNDLGITVLFAEHDLRMALELADRVIVLERGRAVATGRPADLQHDVQVLQAYLGEAAAAS